MNEMIVPGFKTKIDVLLEPEQTSPTFTFSIGFSESETPTTIHQVRVHYGCNTHSYFLQLLPAHHVVLEPRSIVVFSLPFNKPLAIGDTYLAQNPGPEEPKLPNLKLDITTAKDLFLTIAEGHKEDSWVEISFGEGIRYPVMRGHVQEPFSRMVQHCAGVAKPTTVRVLSFDEQVEAVPERLKERAKLARNHSQTLCTMFGAHIERPDQKEDLFDVISKTERYVVDNNSNWKGESSMPENRGHSFIIPAVISHEQKNFRGALLKNVNFGNNNLYFLRSMHFSDKLQCMCLDRLDNWFEYGFDVEVLNEVSEGEGRHLEEFKQTIRSSNFHQRQAVLERLNVKSLKELSSPKQLQRKIDLFKRLIKAWVPHCRRNFLFASIVNELCYATLLMEKIPARTEFELPDYDNTFGDMRVLSNAIYLDTHVLTSDGLLKRMAGYAGIYAEPTVAKIKERMRRAPLR